MPTKYHQRSGPRWFQTNYNYTVCNEKKLIAPPRSTTTDRDYYCPDTYALWQSRTVLNIVAPYTYISSNWTRSVPIVNRLCWPLSSSYTPAAQTDDHILVCQGGKLLAMALKSATTLKYYLRSWTKCCYTQVLNYSKISSEQSNTMLLHSSLNLL